MITLYGTALANKQLQVGGWVLRNSSWQSRQERKEWWLLCAYAPKSAMPLYPDWHSLASKKTAFLFVSLHSDNKKWSNSFLLHYMCRSSHWMDSLRTWKSYDHMTVQWCTTCYHFQTALLWNAAATTVRLFCLRRRGRPTRQTKS